MCPHPKETVLLSNMARLLYSWLPGSASSFGRTYTFADAAAECGLRQHWLGGSKLPAVQTLLEAAYRQASLVPLVTAILREAIKYRDRRRDPLAREEVENLDNLLRGLGYRIPELEDDAFLRSLSGARVGSREGAAQEPDPTRLANLRRQYDLQETNPDLQNRGYELQDLLEGMLEAFHLDPRRPFRVVGEEIDGSFVLDGEVYLLEARWRKKRADKTDLAAFSDKVERKSGWTRGLFVSISGFSPEALLAMRMGKSPKFIVMSGAELRRILQGETPLGVLLRRKVRILAEEGEAQVDE